MSVWLLFFSMIAPSGPCEMIANDRILGEDLVKAQPVFLDKIPGDAVIGYSPAPGARRVFKSLELQRIAASYGVKVAPDAEACFEWSLQTLTDDVVRAAIRESLQSPGARIDVLAVSRNQAPVGKVSFPISGLLASTLSGPDTAVTWRGEVLYHGSRKFSVWARVKISASMSRVVPTQLILPGQNVSADQVRVETYDDFPLRNDIARNLEEVVGRMPRRALRIGSPVFRTDLIEPLEVQRGDLVDVTAISGAAQLRMPALAEAPGRQGDVISLKNPRTGKIFRARIEGKDKALVMPWPLAEQAVSERTMFEQNMPQPASVQ
ncbi:MAG TPA: flagellar basal body P-ring formation chaperone FlgA [Bryobacteraceae bacterium]|jgi:flagella basal body P-ring formation protein FlgA|nr:flagellar basal body P-ring formation chaperone FlgA [Bryobacteraceae bacterium]